MTKLFAHNLIKGKIAEIIFELMFRESDKLVYRFGYEYTEESLAQYRNDFKEQVKGIIDEVSSSPDFIFVGRQNEIGGRGIYVVEVKYRSETSDEELVNIAHKLTERWKSPWIFLVSKQDREFYFIPAHTISNRKGIYPEDNWLNKFINPKLIEEYKELANDWLWSHRD